VSDDLETRWGSPVETAARSAPTLTVPRQSDYVRLQEAVAAIAGTVGVTTRGRQWFPHPFPARMPSDVARAAVARLTNPGAVVLDPMCGSGVVPYCASSLGRVAHGRDIDPLAVLLGRALTANVTPKGVREFCDEVLVAAAARAKALKRPTRFLRKLGKEDRKFLRYWFSTSAVLELFCLAEAIRTRRRRAPAVVGVAVLSSLIISRGAGASYAMDLSRSRPHKVKSKRPRKPFEIWPEKARAFASFYGATTLRHSSTIALGDARKVDLADDSVDAVITSPPYLNAIDYMRTSKFTLIFLGAELEALREIRAVSVGTNVGLATGTLPQHLDALVARSVSESRRAGMVRRYLFDLQQALNQTARVLKPGGVALYVLGPSIVSRRTYDSVEVFALLAEQAGLQSVASARRDLSSVNRSLPPPNRGRRAESLNRRMTCEYYIVLKKPEP
jgi:DNA modification methylase